MAIASNKAVLTLTLISGLSYAWYSFAPPVNPPVLQGFPLLLADATQKDNTQSDPTQSNNTQKNNRSSTDEIVSVLAKPSASISVNASFEDLAAADPVQSNVGSFSIATHLPVFKGSMIKDSAVIPHVLPELSPLTRQIKVGQKQINGHTDYIYRDGFGREAMFRGWNVSGSVKLKSTGFKPFLSVSDAQTSFTRMRRQTGANQVRFTMAWEGVHPEVDVIDYAYLDDIIAQMREAMRQDIHVVLDYHSDLYSRHLFRTDSIHTGNGAPEWIIKGGNHGMDDCTVPCWFTWGAHKLSNSAVRSAMRAFWLNSPITTTKGTRYVQTEFLWQLGEVIDYLNEQLTPTELDYLMGIEPLNEPFDGGIKELGIRNYSEFDNLILWPFYQRVRATMDDHQLADKLVFAEPMVFWNTNTGVFAPTTGWSYLKNNPGEGFVFTPHFYDQARMGVNESRLVDNGSFFAPFIITRNESRYLKMPLFVSEYGMWNEGRGKQDTTRMINGVIQALETSNHDHPSSRFADFYTPFLSGTQWHWDYNYDQHREFLNGNLHRLITEDDGWNNEDFSVIKDNARAYTQDANAIERVYPRRAQGDLLHFAFNSLSKDSNLHPLKWLALRVSVDDEFLQREFLRDKRFAFMAWQGRVAEAPTELFIPNSFRPEHTVVITERSIHKGLQVAQMPKHSGDEVLLTTDPSCRLSTVNGETRQQEGYRLAIWDDPSPTETSTSVHYVVVIEDGLNMSEEKLLALQKGLAQRVLRDRLSPVYLTNKMTESTYERDRGAFDSFQLIDGRSQQCMDVQAGNTRSGTPVQLFGCNNSAAQRWQYLNDQLVSQLVAPNGRPVCLSAGRKVNQQSVIKLAVQPCDDSIGQQFERRPDWGWALKSDPTLRIDAFGMRPLSQVGLWQANGEAQQRWQVQY